MKTRVHCHFLLQWIFTTQGSTLGLRHCTQMLYCLSYQGDDTTVMVESEVELKSLLMRVKEESEKASLKLNIKNEK